MHALSAKHLKLLVDYFKTVSQIDRVILFGSRAMGNHKKGSDIDLAVSGPIDARLLIKIGRVLNDELPISLKFDVVHLGSIAHPDLKKHIEQEGQVIYRREENPKTL